MLIILVLVLANGVFAGAEIALVSLRKTRIEELARKGSRAAVAAQRLRADPERFLATVQIGITVIGATAAAFGGSSFTDDVAPLVRRVPWLVPYAEEIAFVLVVGLISYLSLVLGELVPKSLALRLAEGYALVVSRPLLGLSWVARPLVWFLTTSSNLVLRLFGDRTTFTETRLSREELTQLVDDAAKAGTVHPAAGEIVSRALELPDLTTADVMVPRARIVAISKDASVEAVRSVLQEHPYNRVPVYDGTIDNIVGYFTLKDAFSMTWAASPPALHDLIRPAYFVPESKKAVDLLQELREQRIALSIVVDEVGGTAGIVTMEDLVEELVGEIFSEHDRHPPELIQRQADGSALVRGSVAIRDVNRELQIDLPDDGDWTTVAGLCLALAGKIPVAGEKLVTPNGSSLEIVDASLRRVRLVRVWPPPVRSLN